MKRRLTNAKNKNIVGVDSKNGYRIANIKSTYLIKSKNRTYRIVPTKNREEHRRNLWTLKIQLIKIQTYLL